jgi:hypothetical protein
MSDTSVARLYVGTAASTGRYQPPLSKTITSDFQKTQISVEAQQFSARGVRLDELVINLQEIERLSNIYGSSSNKPQTF